MTYTGIPRWSGRYLRKPSKFQVVHGFEPRRIESFSQTCSRIKLEATSSDFGSKQSIGASTSLLTRVGVLNPLCTRDKKNHRHVTVPQEGPSYLASVGSSFQLVVVEDGGQWGQTTESNNGRKKQETNKNRHAIG